MKYLNWINVILGAVLFAAPFLFSYSGNTAALWSSLILGVLIAALGYLKSYRWAAGMGAIAFIASFILGLTGPGFWTCLLVGAAVAILDGYEGWFTDQPRSGTTQHGHV